MRTNCQLANKWGPDFRRPIGKEIERLIGEGRGRPTSTEKVQEFAQYPDGKKTRDIAAEKAGFERPRNLPASSPLHLYRDVLVPKSWLRKSGQRDKWSFCLTAARMCAAQERP
jgi:hypothetical protein